MHGCIGCNTSKPTALNRSTPVDMIFILMFLHLIMFLTYEYVRGSLHKFLDLIWRNTLRRTKLFSMAPLNIVVNSWQVQCWPLPSAHLTSPQSSSFLLTGVLAMKARSEHFRAMIFMTSSASSLRPCLLPITLLLLVTKRLRETWCSSGLRTFIVAAQALMMNSVQIDRRLWCMRKRLLLSNSWWRLTHGSHAVRWRWPSTSHQQP